MQVYTYVVTNLKNYGNYIEIIINNKFARVNFSNENWKTLINYNIKVILKDGKNYFIK